VDWKLPSIQSQKDGEKTMGHLGVSTINSFEKNYMIIINHHANHGEQITKQRVVFLIVCWKGKYREIARQLKDKYMEFLRMSQSEQLTEIGNAKQYLSSQIITEVSETCYGTKVIYKI
jgi:hypothetical protein